MKTLLEVHKDKITWPKVGQLSKLRKEAIKTVKESAEVRHIILADGRLEQYYGTEANKQGWTKTTYDPAHNRKRPNIPQWIMVSLITITLLTGCAGFKIHAETGLSRIDEQQSSNRTYRQDTVPLICLFKDCKQAIEPSSQGS